MDIRTFARRYLAGMNRWTLFGSLLLAVILIGTWALLSPPTYYKINLSEKLVGDVHEFRYVIEDNQQGGFKYEGDAIREAKRMAIAKAEELETGFTPSESAAKFYINGAISEWVPNSRYQGPEAIAFERKAIKGEAMLVESQAPDGGVVVLSTYVLEEHNRVIVRWYYDTANNPTKYLERWIRPYEIGGHNLTVVLDDDRGHKLNVTVTPRLQLIFDRPVSQA